MVFGYPHAERHDRRKYSMRQNKLEWYTSIMPLKPDVAISQQGTNYLYPETPPFHPGVMTSNGAPLETPEAPFGDFDNASNSVYAAVREAFHLLGLDTSHYGTQDWNPLGEIVHPGDRVLLKPNFVRHFNGYGLDPFSVITHAAVIRAVLDYTHLALRGKGQILVANSPLQSADMDVIRRLTGIDTVLEYFRSCSPVPIDFADLRLEAVQVKDSMVVKKRSIADPKTEYLAVNLGKQSNLESISGRSQQFRVTDFQREAMTAHHQPGRHEYLIPRAVLESDVVINLPKLKTHRKVGVTCALKNLVGINGQKDWLPHHSNRSIVEGGDEYEHPSRRKRLDTWLDEAMDQTDKLWVKRMLLAGRKTVWKSNQYAHFKDPYFEGSWWGNDTLWRTALDLNRILFCADRDGQMTESIQRRYLVVVDGIIAGEGEGPLEPTPRPCGLIAAGENPALVDAVCARIMGFDPEKIPLIREALNAPFLFGTSPGSAERGLKVRSNDPRWERISELSRSETLCFTPTQGWQGHIELE